MSGGLCTECGNPIELLYTDYGSGNIRLTQCDRCGEFADQYLECDSVIIFIDMLLHKPQVYRHLLFNRRVAKGDVYRFGFLLLLFDVCGLRVPECGLALQNNTAIRYQMERSLYVQYFYLLACCLAETIFYHAAIQAFFAVLDWRDWRIERAKLTSVALILSGFPKLLLILMVIWEYNVNYSFLVSIMVFTSNIEALAVIPGRSWLQGFLSPCFAAAGSLLMAWLVHGTVPNWWLTASQMQDRT